MNAKSILVQIRGFAIALALAAGLIYFLIGVGSVPGPSTTPEQQTISAPPPGSEAKLQNGNGTIPVALDEELLPDLLQLKTAPDYSTAIGKLSGRVFFVSAQTEIRVSETGARGVRVRILTGS
ncbi:MAG TPA: hypothetical protein VE994_15290, partial [Terriglobales bacterium]|nr:hypothetical protein [Terriglobales bacterium]